MSELNRFRVEKDCVEIISEDLPRLEFRTEPMLYAEVCSLV